MRIIGAMLVRNEADRWLKQVLQQMLLICDELVIVDDCSTDNTVEICQEVGAQVHPTPESLWGINELLQRKRLWELATQHCVTGDWILNLDADETLVSKEIIPFLGLMSLRNASHDCIGHILYDMWSPTHYREDQWWRAHTVPRYFAVKYNSKKAYQWYDAPLHCGRFPANAGDKMLATGLALQHWGWSTEVDRLNKYARYMKTDPDGKWGIKEQYLSILDTNPNLVEFKR